MPLAFLMCADNSWASLIVAMTTSAPSSKMVPLNPDFEATLSLSLTGVLLRSDKPLATDKPDPNPDVSPLMELVDG